jgi:hypothetical protein
LAALGTNAAAAVPELIELATHHPDDDGRYIAVFAIRTLGSAAEPAIPFTSMPNQQDQHHSGRCRARQDTSIFDLKSLCPL